MAKDRIAWSREDDARLRKLWAAGYPASVIAGAFGRSKNSVIGRAHRLRLPARPSPIGSGHRGAKPRSKPAAHDPMLAARLRARAATRPFDPPRAPMPAASEMPAFTPCVGPAERAAPADTAPAVAATPRPAASSAGCRWPLWSNRERPNHLFCGAAQRLRPDGTRCVYCAEHAARAFTSKHEREPGHQVTRSTFAWGGHVA